ncbi:MAG: purine-nucleoside phosphorylase [Flammeovirgaceae bacterium]
MSLHLEAAPGEVANTVLITGDPLRAKHYAENWLENSVCYNQVRSMLGYTGTYRGKRISIQGTGIGMPSTALYVHELIHSYKVKCIMRLGTCGAIQPQLRLADLVLATEAFGDSWAPRVFLPPNAVSSRPSPQLIAQAESVATSLGIDMTMGAAFSTDLFYSEDKHRYKPWVTQGVLGVDMETYLLYAMTAYYQVKSLTLLTVSDNILTGTAAPVAAREKPADAMIRLALEVAYLTD